MGNEETMLATGSAARPAIEGCNGESVCAACGKKGGTLVTCGCAQCFEFKGRIKSTWYCDNRCQTSHLARHQRETALVGAFANMLLDANKRRFEGKDPCRAFDGDEELFKCPPPPPDCEICCLPLPNAKSQWYHQSCCGKLICHGCIHQVDFLTDTEKCRCPFCRAPAVDSDTVGEVLERLNKRMEVDDGEAFDRYGNIQKEGWYAVKRDPKKAVELWTKGAELGSTTAHYSLGEAYFKGDGVQEDEEKARYHLGIAAIAGDVQARGLLARIELSHAHDSVACYRTGRYESSTSASAREEAGIVNDIPMRRAVRHWTIAAKCGCDDSLRMIKSFYTKRMSDYVTKKDFEEVLRAHKDANDAMKSEARKTALAWTHVQEQLKLGK